MKDKIPSIFISLVQQWRLILVYKTLFLLDPYFVLKSLILASRPRSASPHHRDNNTDSSAPAAVITTATKKMAPVPSPGLPRIIVYYQSHHHRDGPLHGQPISILPLIERRPAIRLTHLNLAAFHINQKPDPSQIITLNDHVPAHPSFDTLWREVATLQAAGVKVLGMLGGAARGTFCKETLDSDEDAVFERYYGALRDMVRERRLDGLDLDVEEHMSLGGIVRLIDRLREDFGKDFLITLAPVAPALLDVRRNLSGFDYEALEVMRGRDIAWYNCQFYCGWGDCSNPILYEMMLMKGWAPEKVVVGLVTNPSNGSGFIPFDVLATVLPLMVGQHNRRFGGVMGWEYFNSLPGGRERPWEWAEWMTRVLGPEQTMAPEVVMPVGKIEMPVSEKKTAELVELAEGGDGQKGKEAPLPGEFEYHSDGIVED